MFNKNLRIFLLVILILNGAIFFQCFPNHEDMEILNDQMQKQMQENPKESLYDKIAQRVIKPLIYLIKNSNVEKKQEEISTEYNLKEALLDELFMGEELFFDKHSSKEPVQKEISEEILKNRKFPETFSLKYLEYYPKTNLSDEIIIHFKKYPGNTAKMILYLGKIDEEGIYPSIIYFEIILEEEDSIKKVDIPIICIFGLCTETPEILEKEDKEKLNNKIFKNPERLFEKENTSFLGTRNILNVPSYCFIKDKKDNYGKSISKIVECEVKDYNIPLWYNYYEDSFVQRHSVPKAVIINEPISDEIFKDITRKNNNIDITFFAKFMGSFKEIDNLL